MKKKIVWFAAAAALMIIVVLFAVLQYFYLLPQRTYSAEVFGVETVKSSVDYNGNGVDDYTDFLLGAKADAKNHPKYDGTYWESGYPPENLGVCTDVVWRAFRNAGYSLRDMVDADIAGNLDAYPTIEQPDSNIDFRRVRNLHIFFERHAVSLTLDINKIEEWQPSDIVIFNGDKHIGIVSDLRNSSGRTYIIHNGGQLRREEDYLGRANVTGHYRFDASRAADILMPFEP